jgi:hypothetical protein
MSQLQLGLLILGVAVLLLLAGYGAWQVHRLQPRRAQAPDSFAAALLQAEQMQEPVLDANAFDDAHFSLPMPEKKPGLDALIDVIAAITPDAPLNGEVLLAAMPPTRRVGSKAFAIEALNMASQRWETPQAGQRYSAMQAGVQLANRSGALNNIEFSEFVVKTQGFCDHINGTPDFPLMRDEVARARELDQFASDHDAQLSFILRARRAAWSPSYIQQTAARLGFVPGVLAGRMVVASNFAGHPPVLSLSFDTQAALADDPTQSALREVLMSLEVAQVPRGERAFERMRESALTLAKEMDGSITDDNGMALPAEAMDVIEQELEHVYDRLDQRELSAGSPLARRLFS